MNILPKQPIPCRRLSTAALTATLAFFPAGLLLAQTSALAPTAGGTTPKSLASAPASASEVLQLDEFIVTGAARGVRKFDSAFSVSTMSETKIERLAPQSSVDLVRKLPGFWTEPSGGEGGNNLAVRGLPSSNFRFVGFFEDGLPNFQEQQQDFLNADELLRVDATIEGVEAVRGGTSSIFSSNSPGANVNFITKKGGATREGLARFTVSDYGQLRWDGVVSGPVAEGLTGSLGGFYRVDDGQRDAGFTGNKGGQLRLSLTHQFKEGSITAYVKNLHDRNIFYTPIPLADPRNPSVSLAGLLDPHTGTLFSNDFRYARIRTLNGTPGGTANDRDLADGIYSRILTAGLMANIKIGDGWELSNHFRVMNGDVRFNAIFSTTAPDDAAVFLAQQLTRAQAGFGAAATSAKYVLANSRNADGSRIAFDPATTGGLVIRMGWWNMETSMSNLLDDLRVTKTFGAGVGRHEIAAGIYFSDYSFDQLIYQNTNLVELRNRPRALDIIALDPSGTTVGSVTERGFVQYGTNANPGGHVEGRMLAPYVSDSWQVTSALRFDAGLRIHNQRDRGYALLRTTQNLGDATTLADDNVGGASGQVENREASYHTKSWTVGANLDVTRSIGLFGRYTSTFRTPNLSNIYQRATTPVVDIHEAELGAKLRSRSFSLFSSVFWNKFSPLLENIAQPDANGIFVTIPFRAETKTYGAEVEATWTPVSFFELSGNVTVQNPEYLSLIDTRTNTSVAASGNNVRRIPKRMLNLQPKFLFDAAGYRGEAYAALYYAGARFVDSANKTTLPAFTTLDAGVTFYFSEHLSLQLVGSNLNNSAGLTEGNGRVDQISGQGTREAIYGRPMFGRSFRSVVTYHF